MSSEPQNLLEALDWIDWYRRNLEGIQDGHIVRGLAESKAGYDAAYRYIEKKALSLEAYNA